MCPWCRQVSSTRGYKHGLTRGLYFGCDCDVCYDAVCDAELAVRYRTNGMLLRNIANILGLGSRERARQITEYAAPWRPWEALDIEAKALAAEREWVARNLTKVPCGVCGRDRVPLVGNHKFCSDYCYRVANIYLRRATESQEKLEAHRIHVARWHVAHPDQVTESQLDWARRILDPDEDVPDHGEAHGRWFTSDSKALEVAIEVYEAGWPIFDKLPEQMQDQVRTESRRRRRLANVV